ncbi:type VI secretion system baseplate subunit TssF [Spirosoma radiotolerans]|uniref:Type VI secretion system baseplate subunit TssF n=1 Tax=Spirosoma radiotolerans TaxID=1379870 RepID=A0A0E3ZX95_9BACT|nr:type VI secretion system baseplate subunit TssF [Spirosoma radiotolerans]AKD56065.1 hypothetical protein SD10_15345 [Spirosoma radiotolerans]
MPLSDQRSHFSKEAIRQRLLLHIMQMWGVRDLNNLDSFVRMLIDTLANEVHKISHEFMESEGRVLEHLADLLTPDLLTIPQPAHAIMQAYPAEPVVELGPNQSFLFQQKYASQLMGELDSLQDLFFSAVDSLRLVDGRVAYLAAGSQLHAIHPQLGKRLVVQSMPHRKLAPKTLWIGLALNPAIDSLDRVNFFFNWPSDVDAQPLLPLLALSSWYINGSPLQTATGPAYAEASERSSDGPAKLLSEYEISYQLENDIRQTYQTRFVHIKQSASGELEKLKVPYPAAFGEVFSAQGLQSVGSEPLLWLEVTFPARFDETILEKIAVELNAFPALNRKANRNLYRTNANYNLLPLQTAPFETLLLVRMVVDSKERVFTPFPFHKADHIDEGGYAVRRGGVERFDVRNAREQLTFLLELLRDESVAFAVYGQDTVRLLLTQLQEKIEQLERKVHTTMTSSTALNQYVLFKPFEEGDTMQVDFWTTNCELANHIPAGTSLQAYSSSSLQGESIKLLTTTLGGRSRPSALHRVQTYRYALMTHQRIVTLEDIRAFFHHELGPLLESVTIRKGVATGNTQKEGLIRTVDISLHPAEDCTLTQDEWRVMMEGLLQKLIHRSGQVTSYRLFLAQETPQV